MAYITVELTREDFQKDHFEKFHDGYIPRLDLGKTKNSLYSILINANKVFINYNGSEYILKQK